jgi:hypothetical protein
LFLLIQRRVPLIVKLGRVHMVGGMMLRLVKPEGEATIDVLPRLRSVLSAEEFNRRASRPPDYEAENRALIDLAQAMAISPDGILQKLAEAALRLCRAHSAGLSLLEEGDLRKNFHCEPSLDSGLLT